MQDGTRTHAKGSRKNFTKRHNKLVPNKVATSFLHLTHLLVSFRPSCLIEIEIIFVNLTIIEKKKNKYLTYGIASTDLNPMLGKIKLKQFLLVL